MNDDYEEAMAGNSADTVQVFMCHPEGTEVVCKNCGAAFPVTEEGLEAFQAHKHYCAQFHDIDVRGC